MANASISLMKKFCQWQAKVFKFIVNSDAHTPDRVGEVNNGLNLIYRLNIPLSQVANVDKLPKFNKKRGF